MAATVGGAAAAGAGAGAVRLVAAIDQGTSSSRVIVFDAAHARVVALAQIELPLSTPHEGSVRAGRPRETEAAPAQPPARS